MTKIVLLFKVSSTNVSNCSRSLTEGIVKVKRGGSGIRVCWIIKTVDGGSKDVVGAAGVDAGAGVCDVVGAVGVGDFGVEVVYGVGS